MTMSLLQTRAMGIPTTKTQTIVIDGDVTIDWNLARTKRTDLSASAWNAEDSTRAYCQRGGAALLADLIAATAKRLEQSAGASEYDIVGPAPTGPVHPGDPQFHHSYAMWSLFEYDMSQGSKGKQPKSWRVQEFLGLDRNASHDGRRNEPVAPGLTAEIVALDDADLGFRDQPARWPESLKNPSRPWVVLKMARPIAQGRLWEYLHGNIADRLIVIMSVNDLRLSEVQISRELSWERTAQDLAWELVHNPRVNSLSRAHSVVVSFETAGAFLLQPGPRCWLFFDPSVIEGTWNVTRPGGMIGYTSCLAAAAVSSLIRSPSAPDISAAIQAGLSAMRLLHLEGYGVRGTTASDAALMFPIDPVAGELCGQSSKFAVAEVQDPLINIAKTSTRKSAAAANTSRGYWTILEDRYVESLGDVAERIVIEGAEAALQDVPLGRFGQLLTIDRREIESFRSIRVLVGEYCRKRKQKRPLSIAVFGSPGSGKSFGIIQIAESLLPGEIKVLEFNISQFRGHDDFLDALHQVRDAGLSGQIPLVFWDEFDTPLDGRTFGWLRHFLAPMQDGKFLQGQVSHPIGRSIFVFAGGISESMEAFGRDLPEKDFRDAKGPDFVSRLKGYVNILGPNPQSLEGGVSDPFYVIRRAILLRSILRRDAAQLFESRSGRELLNIDSGVLRALLHTRRYRHGVRSMESVIAMSQLSGKSRFERSCLPAIAQLDLHVEAQDFQSLVQQMDLEGELLERLAEAAHEVFVQKLRDQGYTFGRATDDDKKTHSSLKPFSDLPEEEKEQNRANVRDIPLKLARVGYAIIPARSNEPPFNFPGDDLESLAQQEHERWMTSKIAAGWLWAAETDKNNKLHQDLVPWRRASSEQRAEWYGTAGSSVLGPDELPESEKEKDRLLIRAIPQILSRAGYTIVKVGEGK